jgi:hypothetical protein
MSKQTRLQINPFAGKCLCSPGPAAALFLLYFLPGSGQSHCVGPRVDVLLDLDLLLYLLLLVLVALTIVLLKGGGFSSVSVCFFLRPCIAAINHKQPFSLSLLKAADLEWGLLCASASTATCVQRSHVPRFCCCALGSFLCVQMLE